MSTLRFYQKPAERAALALQRALSSLQCLEGDRERDYEYLREALAQVFTATRELQAANRVARLLAPREGSDEGE